MTLPVQILAITGAFVAIGVLQFAALVAIGYLFRAFGALFSPVAASEPTEDQRMEILRRQMDELWDDDEDPLAEAEAEQRAAMRAEWGEWMDSLTIANPWTVAE